MCKISFAEQGLFGKLVSDAGTSFVSEKFQDLYRCLDTNHAASSLYNNKSNGQAEACIKFMRRAMKRCFETNADI